MVSKMESNFNLYRRLMADTSKCELEIGLKKEELEALAHRFIAAEGNWDLVRGLYNMSPDNHQGLSPEEIIQSYIAEALLRLRAPCDNQTVRRMLKSPDFVVGDNILWLNAIEEGIIKSLPGRAQYFLKEQFEQWEAYWYETHKFQGCVLMLAVWKIPVPDSYPMAGLLGDNANQSTLKVLVLIALPLQIVYWEVFPNTYTDQRCWLESQIYNRQFKEGAPYENQLPAAFRCRDTRDCHSVFKPIIVANSLFSFRDSGPYVHAVGAEKWVSGRYLCAPADLHGWEQKLLRVLIHVQIPIAAILATFKRLVTGIHNHESLMRSFAAAVAIYNASNTHALRICEREDCHACRPKVVNREFVIEAGNVAEWSRAFGCYMCIFDDIPDGYHKRMDSELQYVLSRIPQHQWPFHHGSPPDRNHPYRESFRRPPPEVPVAVAAAMPAIEVAELERIMRFMHEKKNAAAQADTADSNEPVPQ